MINEKTIEPFEFNKLYEGYLIQKRKKNEKK